MRVQDVKAFKKRQKLCPGHQSVKYQEEEIELLMNAGGASPEMTLMERLILRFVTTIMMLE